MSHKEIIKQLEAAWEQGMNSLGETLTDAIEFARWAHQGQVRKYNGGDYVDNHLIPVMQAVRDKYPDDVNMQIAALLHDTLEDTDTIAYTLARKFNQDVANLVAELTDQYTPEFYPEFNRSDRKKMEAMRLADISDRAKAIKVEDINNNVSNLVSSDPKFAIIYLREKAYTLEQMLGE